MSGVGLIDSTPPPTRYTAALGPCAAKAVGTSTPADTTAAVAHTIGRGNAVRLRRNPGKAPPQVMSQETVQRRTARYLPATSSFVTRHQRRHCALFRQRQAT